MVFSTDPAGIQPVTSTTRWAATELNKQMEPPEPIPVRTRLATVWPPLKFTLEARGKAWPQRYTVT